MAEETEICEEQGGGESIEERALSRLSCLMSNYPYEFIEAMILIGRQEAYEMCMRFESIRPRHYMGDGADYVPKLVQDNNMTVKIKSMMSVIRIERTKKDG